MSFWEEASAAKERATDGRSLYEASRSFGRLATIGKYLLEGDPWDREWDALPWDEKDHWEAQADELNEARRGTP